MWNPIPGLIVLAVVILVLGGLVFWGLGELSSHIQISVRWV